MMHSKQDGEAGFTLVEALVAIVILVFGLMAVSNLFIVSGSSNQTGNHSTAATQEATEVMERLMAVPFDQLVVGGGTTAATFGDFHTNTADIGVANCTESATDAPGGPPLPPPAQDCVTTPGNYNMARWFAGVGRIKTPWQVINPNAAGIATYFIRVRSESQSPIVGGPRSGAEMTMFRTCTTSGCPGIP